MAESVQVRILGALKIALKPLARALISAGFSYREFAEVGKAAFVEVAATDFGIRGRPTNNSRIAVITGLGRKEVKKVLDKAAAGSAVEFVNESPASVVIHNWKNDPEYWDEDGEPSDLAFDGTSPSFSSLVSKYAGDIPPGAMKTELVRVGAVQELDGGALRVIAPYFVPNSLSDRLIIGLEEIAATALATLAFNCDPKRKEEPRFQRIASVDGISSEFHAEIEKYAKAKLTDFGLEFCSYLDDYERRSEGQPPDSRDRQVGIGLYFYNVGDNQK